MLPPPFKQPPRRLAIQARRTRQDEVVAQWRRMDSSDERALSRKIRSAGDILPRVLGSLGMEKKLNDAEILKSWSHLMDPNVTAHAQPSGLRNGTLFVSVDSNVWLDEIVRYRRKEILDRLQHTFGRDLVKRISFRVG